MSLRYAVLGLLSQRAMNGFELLKEFDAGQSVIWPAPQNEVYRVLAALVRDGLITEQAQGARGARTYAVTDEGRIVLAHWLAEPSDYSLRYAPILKAVFLRQASPQTRRARAEADLAFFMGQLDVLRASHAARAKSAEEDIRGDARTMAIAIYAALAEWARGILAEYD